LIRSVSSRSRAEVMDPVPVIREEHPRNIRGSFPYVLIIFPHFDVWIPFPC